MRQPLKEADSLVRIPQPIYINRDSRQIERTSEEEKQKKKPGYKRPLRGTRTGLDDETVG